MIVVANAGPLIALAEIGCFDLLKSLYGRIHIPTAVRDEVVVSQDGRPGALEVETAAWVQVMSVRDVTAVKNLEIKCLLFAERQEFLNRRDAEFAEKTS